MQGSLTLSVLVSRFVQGLIRTVTVEHCVCMHVKLSIAQRLSHGTHELQELLGEQVFHPKE